MFVLILVDRDIKELADNKQLIISGYNEDNVNCISYDLTLDYCIDSNGEKHKEFEIQPGETIFICTAEKLSIPLNMLGRIAEKNSRIRQGLVVSGPHFQPGHVTYAFLRISNISTNVIVLKQGMKIAQIIFEQLTQEPEIPYNQQEGAAFNEEVEFRGLGNYEEEYAKQSKKVLDRQKEDIQNLSQNIYANVLTIMGVLVAIFSMLSINYQAFIQATITSGYIIVMNLTLALCIVVMMGIIFLFINKAEHKGFIWVYLIILSILAVATIIMGIQLF